MVHTRCFKKICRAPLIFLCTRIMTSMTTIACVSSFLQEKAFCATMRLSLSQVSLTRLTLTQYKCLSRLCQMMCYTIRYQAGFVSQTCSQTQPGNCSDKLNRGGHAYKQFVTGYITTSASSMERVHRSQQQLTYSNSV